jgi:hypothetical protein
MGALGQAWRLSRGDEEEEEEDEEEEDEEEEEEEDEEEEEEVEVRPGERWTTRVLLDGWYWVALL